MIPSPPLPRLYGAGNQDSNGISCDWNSAEHHIQNRLHCYQSVVGNPSPPHSLFFCVYLPSFRFLSSSVSDKSHSHTAAASFQKLLSAHCTRHKLIVLVVTLRRRAPLSSGTRVSHRTRRFQLSSSNRFNNLAK